MWQTHSVNVSCVSRVLSLCVTCSQWLQEPPGLEWALGPCSGNTRSNWCHVDHNSWIYINPKHLSSIYNAALKRKARQILYDPTHPLNDTFQELPSGRRLNVPLAKKNLFKKSFIPSAILI